MSSDNEKLKKKVRNTSRWKKFRSDIIRKRKVDALTNRKLLKGCQLHHLCMAAETYGDFDETKYIALNRNSHKLVHFMFEYYKHDRQIIDRLKDILDKMLELN